MISCHRSVSSGDSPAGGWGGRTLWPGEPDFRAPAPGDGDGDCEGEGIGEGRGEGEGNGDIRRDGSGMGGGGTDGGFGRGDGDADAGGSGKSDGIDGDDARDVSGGGCTVVRGARRTSTCFVTSSRYVR